MRHSKSREIALFCNWWAQKCKHRRRFGVLTEWNSAGKHMEQIPSVLITLIIELTIYQTAVTHQISKCSERLCLEHYLFHAIKHLNKTKQTKFECVMRSTKLRSRCILECNEPWTRGAVDGKTWCAYLPVGADRGLIAFTPQLNC